MRILTPDMMYTIVENAVFSELDRTDMLEADKQKYRDRVMNLPHGFTKTLKYRKELKNLLLDMLRSGCDVNRINQEIETATDYKSIKHKKVSEL